MKPDSNLDIFPFFLADLCRTKIRRRIQLSAAGSTSWSYLTHTLYDFYVKLCIFKRFTSYLCLWLHLCSCFYHCRQIFNVMYCIHLSLINKVYLLICAQWSALLSGGTKVSGAWGHKSIWRLSFHFSSLLSTPPLRSRVLKSKPP